MASVREFMERNFKHFNARETLDAAVGYQRLIDDGGKMLVSLAGAMSTGELGITLAEMIREDKVHAISCTAANLEEDVFNLVAHDEYKMLPNYRDLTPEQEVALVEQKLNRVTDTCIPESVMLDIEGRIIPRWAEAAEKNEPRFPQEFLFDLLRSGELESSYQIDPANSWMLAAAQKNLPVFVPGFEDSTLGNMYTASVMRGNVKGHHGVRTGTEQMQWLVEWYLEQTSGGSQIGFFQIGGGIAGDFAICAVPLILQDLKRECPMWGYFAQIGDSTTSYGSYSGAVPNEKITWLKLTPETPRFMINSDASIVAPLVFAYVLGQ